MSRTQTTNGLTWELCTSLCAFTSHADDGGCDKIVRWSGGGNRSECVESAASVVLPNSFVCPCAFVVPLAVDDLQVIELHRLPGLVGSNAS